MDDKRAAWLESCHSRLERHIDESYYPGARDDLRDLFHAALATQPQPSQKGEGDE